MTWSWRDVWPKPWRAIQRRSGAQDHARCAALSGGVRPVSGEEYVRRVWADLVDECNRLVAVKGYMGIIHYERLWALQQAADKLYEIACRPWFEEQGPAGNLARNAAALERLEKAGADILNNSFAMPQAQQCVRCGLLDGAHTPDCWNWQHIISEGLIGGEAAPPTPPAPIRYRATLMFDDRTEVIEGTLDPLDVEQLRELLK